MANGVENVSRFKMTETQFRRATILGLIAIVLVWFAYPLVQGLVFSDSKPRLVAARGDLAGFEITATKVFEADAPSVVYIFTERRERTFFGGETRQQGAGSGFIWDQAGHIITNEHVIAGADRVFVRFDTGEAAPAKYVGGSVDHDLAVLRVSKAPVKLKPIPIGSSSDLKIGQAVFAIGNPFGLSRTLTSGIVSALDRRLPTHSGREITGVIQTDAAINPGNSGGPLIDSAGRLIGVNSAIISGTGSYSGIGFAIPVDTVSRIVPQIIRNGRPARPGIGIQVGSDELAARLNVHGVVVIAVQPNGPAAKAGLKGIDRVARELGDIIVAVNDERVRTTSEYTNALEAVGVGKQATLTILRNGKERKVAVTLADVG